MSKRSEAGRRDWRRTARIGALVGFVVSMATAAHAQAPIENCLDSHGMGLAGGHSAAVASNVAVWLFGGPGGGDVLCDPSFPRSAESVGTNGTVGIVSYVAGTGAYLTTGAIAPQVSSSRGDGYFAGHLYYKFRVIPDEPNSTAPVTLEFVTRQRFGGVHTSESGPIAFARNTFSAKYWIYEIPGPSLAAIWNAGSVPPMDNSYYDIVESVVLDVNVDHYFVAELRQQSVAAGRLSPASLATADMASLWTFEATTDDAATIQWEVETLLGLDPPQLDVVPEPAFGGALASGLIGLSTFARRHGRRGRFPVTRSES